MTSPGGTPFERARELVRRGVTPEAAAADVVAAMTQDERLWCLDGDVPALAGLAFMAEDGYHRAPFPAARVERVGLPGFAFSDGPRGVVIGKHPRHHPQVDEGCGERH